MSSQEECKKQAIELVGRAWTSNPPLRWELLAEAQVWATLATVPDMTTLSVAEQERPTPTGAPEPPMGGDPAAVLRRASELAEHAGKHRTAEWLRECLEAWRFGRVWPDAPRYKGPLQDLDALTDDALRELRSKVTEELQSRLAESMPLSELRGQPWKSGGGAGQWNG